MIGWQCVKQESTPSLNWCWLPGWGFSADIFSDYWHQLPGNHWQANYQTTERNFEQAACYLGETAPQGAIWVGWSLGGALAVAAQQHTQASRLVTLATAHKFVADQGMTPARFSAFKQQMHTAPEKTAKRFLSLCCQKARSPHALMRQLKPHQLAYSAELLHTLNWLETYQLREHKAVTSHQHALHLYGQEDALAPTQMQPALISNSKSHAFFLESDQLLTILNTKVANGST